MARSGFFLVLIRKRATEVSFRQAQGYLLSRSFLNMRWCGVVDLADRVASGMGRIAANGRTAFWLAGPNEAFTLYNWLLSGCEHGKGNEWT